MFIQRHMKYRGVLNIRPAADPDVIDVSAYNRVKPHGAFLAKLDVAKSILAAREEAAKPGALVMHPGPMNRGVEIDPAVADGPQSLIREQVEMGVAVRMAAMDLLARNLRAERGAKASEMMA